MTICTLENIPLGHIITDDSNINDNYMIPTANSVDNIQVIEMVELPRNRNDQESYQENYQENRCFTKKINRYCTFRWCFSFLVLFFIFNFMAYNVLNINSKLDKDSFPTLSPTYSLVPTPDPTECSNKNCLVVIWESKKYTNKIIMGSGRNISFRGQDNQNKDSHILNLYKPNLSSKNSILEIYGPKNCSVIFSDLQLNPSEWIYCNIKYKCDIKFSGFYDLSNEAYSTTDNGEILENWSNKIESVIINEL